MRLISDGFFILYFKKIKKFIITPGVFFRDFFVKKYPIINSEVRCSKEDEIALINNDLILDGKMDVQFPIDVVFTWVNDKDPVWQSKYSMYKNNKSISYGRYATDLARFSNHNELYFSVKSVKKNLPWVRTIFVVTDNQCPEWLGEFKNIKIIDHSEIINSKYLPTFNSHVIEAHLHNIPELAEHFIYFNDDVFVARNLPAGHFFKSNGLASLYLSDKSLSDMRFRGVVTPTLNASLSASKLFERDFKYKIDTPLVHTYVPLRKSMFNKVWDKYHEEINSFLSNRFRTNNDLNLATFVVPWLTFIYGYATPCRDICYYFNIRSVSANKYYTLLEGSILEGSAPHSFCANDFTAKSSSNDNYQAKLLNLLNKYYGSHVHNDEKNI